MNQSIKNERKFRLVFKLYAKEWNMNWCLRRFWMIWSMVSQSYREPQMGLKKLETPPYTEWSSQSGNGIAFIFNDNTWKKKIISLEGTTVIRIPKTLASIAREVSHPSSLSTNVAKNCVNNQALIYIKPLSEHCCTLNLSVTLAPHPIGELNGVQIIRYRFTFTDYHLSCTVVDTSKTKLELQQVLCLSLMDIAISILSHISISSITWRKIHP